MGSIARIVDLAECARLWRDLVPRESLTDLWEVRECFQRHFQRPPLFILHRERGRTQGLLPLSWIEEAGCYGYFPGETWQERTWLEQNRMLASSRRVWQEMLAAIPGPYELRYLRPDPQINGQALAVDEVGYLFEPPLYRYDLERFWGEFSGKHKKQVRAALEALENREIHYVVNRPGDLTLMIEMNLDRFGESSYFHDERFRAAILDLGRWLGRQGWLRLVSLEIQGEPAAVDMGCLRGDKLTVMAGGVNPAWPGAAKLINLHHLRFACEQKLGEVDFLCGDFKWKKLWHLNPRPLYRISSRIEADLRQDRTEAGILFAP